MRSEISPGLIVNCVRLFSVAAVICAVPAIAAPRVCPGDCDRDGTITVAELVRGVDILLGTADLGFCSPLDDDHDGRATIDEVIKAVDSAIHRCAADPSPSPTITPVANGPPEIDISPPTLSLACSGSFDIVISNSGSPGSTLQITSLTLTHGYSQGDYGTGFSWFGTIFFPVSLGAGESLTLSSVEFNAAGQLYRSRFELRVESDANDSPHAFHAYFGGSESVCTTPTPTPAATRTPVALSTCDAADLVAAIDAANGETEPSIIRLGEHCTYTLETANNADESRGANGLPVIAADITIDGRGSTITCRYACGFRIFQVAPGGALRLENIAVTNGHSEPGSYPGQSGGCIYNDGGTLVLTDATVANCATSDGFRGIAGDGGAIYNFRGATQLIRSVVAGNHTGGRLAPYESSIGNGGRGGGGGGLYNAYGTMTLTHSTVTGNTTGYGHRCQPGCSGGTGGGIANYAGTVAVIASTVADNRTGDGGEGGLGHPGGRGGTGGGISNDGTLIIVDSTINDNAAGTGGFGNRPSGTSGGPGGRGGAIDNLGTAFIVNSTISGNSSGTGGQGYPDRGPDGDGGGIYDYGSGDLRNVTVARNTARSARGGGLATNRPAGLRVANSIVADNTAGDSPDCAVAFEGTFVSEGHNLIGRADGCEWNGVEGDRLGTSELPVDPLLGPLENNDGPTATHVLSIESPAIDAGDPTGCTDAAAAPLVADQRGEPRVQDGDGDGQAVCDIGAYERR